MYIMTKKRSPAFNRASYLSHDFKGKKEEIKTHAEKYDGGSVNAFIQRAIAETMERDEAKDNR